MTLFLFRGWDAVSSRARIRRCAPTGAGARTASRNAELSDQYWTNAA
jgi:hypothetical protein